ncbi:hypothetical protein R1sor_018743 [Riccia sorocarpa]|uniref:Uncharacterized protein n=1 Tax=Riccia sorocarpa TaxID=122646 RepID=A0ABD3IEM5_9MARC
MNLLSGILAEQKEIGSTIGEQALEASGSVQNVGIGKWTSTPGSAVTTDSMLVAGSTQRTNQRERERSTSPNFFNWDGNPVQQPESALGGALAMIIEDTTKQMIYQSQVGSGQYTEPDLPVTTGGTTGWNSKSSLPRDPETDPLGEKSTAGATPNQPRSAKGNDPQETNPTGDRNAGPDQAIGTGVTALVSSEPGSPPRYQVHPACKQQ